MHVYVYILVPQTYINHLPLCCVSYEGNVNSFLFCIQPNINGYEVSIRFRYISHSYDDYLIVGSLLPSDPRVLLSTECGGDEAALTVPERGGGKGNCRWGTWGKQMSPFICDSGFVAKLVALIVVLRSGLRPFLSGHSCLDSPAGTS